MEPSFLTYLTLANPEVDSTACKGSDSSKSSQRYKPDDVKPWTDLTLKNFEATYKDVLLHPLGDPERRNATEVPPRMTRLFEEESVKRLTECWNEKVVQHVLHGTQSLLNQKLPGGLFADGQLYFTRNCGEGHIPNDRGILQRPDWCLYRAAADAGVGVYKNLLPGDIKPAKRWKSEWINSSKTSLKRKANLMLAQITKYMALGNTRYGFILSEEELVPMRLSKFMRDTQAQEELAQHESTYAEQLTNSSMSFNEDPDGCYADAARREGVRLEYCRIPWTASGENSFTVNLALWWLSVLAVQEASIKGIGTYTSLGTVIRGSSPMWVAGVEEREARGEKRKATPPRRLKRKAEEITADLPLTRKASHQYSLRSGHVSSRARASGATPRRAAYEVAMSDGTSTDPGQSFLSEASSTGSKRPRRSAIE
ncbi:hypothetical protein F5B17DRAFT_452645 [Nemania serpens]|nr:hypothetical protein F5B17DRAFT_452645 [Nemania serpens]